MNLRKLTTILLMVTLSVGLIGCGNTNKNKNENKSTEAVETTETQKTEASENTKSDDKEKASVVETIDYETLKYDNYVELPDYNKKFKDITVEDVTDEQLKTEIDSYLNYNSSLSEVTDREVQSGDVVTISLSAGDDFNQESILYQVGGNYYGKAFDKELIGMEIGDKKTITTTFDEYPTELAGQKASVETKLEAISILEVPEYNDEFVSTLTNNEYETTEEFEKYIKEYLKTNNKTTAIYTALDEIVEESTFSNIDDLVENEFNISKEMYKEYSEELGGTYEEMVQSYFGYSTVEEFEEMLHSNCEALVKQKLIIYSIAEKENISVSDEEFTTYTEENASNYGYDSAEDFIDTEGKDIIKYSLLFDKVIENFTE